MAQVAHATVASTCQHSVGARDLTRRVEDIGLRVFENTSLMENPMPKKLANEMETRGLLRFVLQVKNRIQKRASLVLWVVPNYINSKRSSWWSLQYLNLLMLQMVFFFLPCHIALHSIGVAP